MSIRVSLGQFEQLAKTVGGSGALLLVAFFGRSGKSNIYVPQVATDDHIIARLIGPADFRVLVEEFGGQSVPVPNLDGLRAVEHAGRVATLARYSVPNRVIAQSLGISARRVEQLRAQLEADGLAGILPDGVETAFAGDHEEAPQPQRRVARSAYVGHQPRAAA